LFIPPGNDIYKKAALFVLSFVLRSISEGYTLLTEDSETIVNAFATMVNPGAPFLIQLKQW